MQDFARKVTWYFTAVVLIRIFISLQRNVTTLEFWDISEHSIEDQDFVNRNHTEGHLTSFKFY